MEVCIERDVLAGCIALHGYVDSFLPPTHPRISTLIPYIDLFFCVLIKLSVDCGTHSFILLKYTINTPILHYNHSSLNELE